TPSTGGRARRSVLARAGDGGSFAVLLWRREQLAHAFDRPLPAFGYRDRDLASRLDDEGTAAVQRHDDKLAASRHRERSNPAHDAHRSSKRLSSSIVPVQPRNRTSASQLMDTSFMAATKTRARRARRS